MRSCEKAPGRVIEVPLSLEYDSDSSIDAQVLITANGASKGILAVDSDSLQYFSFSVQFGWSLGPVDRLMGL